MTKYITHTLGAIIYHGLALVAIVGFGVLANDYIDKKYSPTKE